MAGRAPSAVAWAGIVAGGLLGGCLGPGTLNEPQCHDDARRLIAEQCLPCHSANVVGDERRDAPEGVDFDTEDDLREHLEGIRESVVRDGWMPPAASLSECDRRLVDRYLAGLE